MKTKSYTSDFEGYVHLFEIGYHRIRLHSSADVESTVIQSHFFDGQTIGAHRNSISCFDFRNRIIIILKK